MTFNKMVKIEPQLGELRDELVEIMAGSPGSWLKRNNFWYKKIKPRLIKLVGLMAEKPDLRNSEDYSAAYEELRKILKV